MRPRRARRSPWALADARSSGDGREEIPPNDFEPRGRAELLLRTTVPARRAADPTTAAAPPDRAIVRIRRRFHSFEFPQRPALAPAPAPRTFGAAVTISDQTICSKTS